MLSVLAFKKSLFAGVLDGGESEIFMNGTRLSKFMESVEEVTGSMGKAEPAAETNASEPDTDISRPPSSNNGQRISIPATSVEAVEAQNALGAEGSPDPWAPLLDVGLKLVESLAEARNGNDRSNADSPAWTEVDPDTGKSYLKIPVPDPATIQRLAAALSELLVGLRR
jgi:hypothetical protein